MQGGGRHLAPSCRILWPINANYTSTVKHVSSSLVDHSSRQVERKEAGSKMARQKSVTMAQRSRQRSAPNAMGDEGGALLALTAHIYVKRFVVKFVLRVLYQFNHISVRFIV